MFALPIYEFVAAATTALGHPIEVIAGAEEARLVYSGVMQGRSRARPRRLVVDIGGGSTELIIGRGDKPKLMESVSLGCVVHTQRFFGDGMSSEERRVGKGGVRACRIRWWRQHYKNKKVKK